MTKREFLNKLAKNKNLRLIWWAVLSLGGSTTPIIKLEAGLKLKTVTYWLNKLEEWGLIVAVSPGIYYITAKGFHWSRK